MKHVPSTGNFGGSSVQRQGRPFPSLQGQGSPASELGTTINVWKWRLNLKLETGIEHPILNIELKFDCETQIKHGIWNWDWTLCLPWQRHGLKPHRWSTTMGNAQLVCYWRRQMVMNILDISKGLFCMCIKPFHLEQITYDHLPLPITYRLNHPIYNRSPIPNFSHCH